MKINIPGTKNVTGKKERWCRLKDGLFADAPEGEEAWVLVSPLPSTEQRAKQTRLLSELMGIGIQQRKGFRHRNATAATMEQQLEAGLRSYAGTILKGWHYFLDDKGVVVPYTEQTAESLLSDSDYSDFADWVVTVARELGEKDPEIDTESATDAAGNPPTG